MKNTIVFILMISIFSFLSCSSLQKIEKQNLDIHQLDLVKLQQSKSDVLKILGNPTTSNVEADVEHWFYADIDKDGIQRGTVTFDAKTKKVIGITAIPRETDLELQLSYLTDKKFKSLVFEKVSLGRCQRDYIPQQEFYINTLTGMIIEYNYVHQTVESYAHSSPQYALEFIQQLQSCKR